MYIAPATDKKNSRTKKNRKILNGKGTHFVAIDSILNCREYLIYWKFPQPFNDNIYKGNLCSLHLSQNKCLPHTNAHEKWVNIHGIRFGGSINECTRKRISPDFVCTHAWKWCRWWCYCCCKARPNFRCAIFFCVTFYVRRFSWFHLTYCKSS